MRKAKKITLFYSIWIFLLFSFTLVKCENIIDSSFKSIHTYSWIKAQPHLEFGVWLFKKIKKPAKPIKLTGETWLPIKNNSQLSFKFIVKSTTNNASENLKLDLLTLDDLLQLQKIINNRIYSIYISNINNIYLYQKLNSDFHFTDILKTKPTNIKSTLNNLSYKLRFSGYFSKVNLFFHTEEKTLIFSLELEINPILYSIEFLDTDKLLISNEALCELASKQIGYPKSLNQLSTLTKNIIHWYNCRGYKWISAITFDQENHHHAYIKVTEKFIKKITYNLYPLINHEIPKDIPEDKLLPFNLINYLANIFFKINTRPNILKIEKAMHILKETRFFYNFYYDIKTSPESSNVEIIICFIPYTDNQVYANIEKILKKLGSIPQEDIYIENLIHLVLKDSSKLHSYQQPVSSNTYKNLSTLYLYNFDKSYNSNNILIDIESYTPLLQRDLGINEKFELYQYHSKIYFFQESRHLGFKYDFVNFTYKEEDHVSQYDFSYNIPINIDKPIFLPIATRIFDNLTLIKNQNQKFSFNALMQTKKTFSSTVEIRRKGVELFFKKKFKYYENNISSTLTTRNINYKTLNFKRNHLLFHHLRKSLKITKNSVLNNFKTPKEIKKMICQKFYIFNFRIQLPKVDDWFHPTTGDFLQVDFLQFRPNYKIISTSYTSQAYTNEMYFLKYIKYLRTRPKDQYSAYHMILWKIFIGNLSGKKTLYSLPDRLRYQKYTAVNVGYSEISKEPNHLSEYLFEYHFRMFYYTNPVIFIKFLKDSPLFEEYPFPHIQGELFYSKRLNLSNLSTGKYIGIGWEFRTIIPQIPPIRIEFIPQLAGKDKISIRVIPYLY